MYQGKFASTSPLQARFETYMGVGTSDSERIDADPLGTFLGPRNWISRHGELGGFPRDYNQRSVSHSIAYIGWVGVILLGFGFLK